MRTGIINSGQVIAGGAGMSQPTVWVDTSGDQLSWINSDGTPSWPSTYQAFPTYTSLFTAIDLIDNVLTITHSLNSRYVMVLVVNDSQQQVIPTRITFTDANNINIDFTDITVSNTWLVGVMPLFGSVVVPPPPRLGALLAVVLPIVL